MKDTVPAAATGLPNAIRDHIVAFSKNHWQRDPLDEAISAAADRSLTEALVAAGGAHLL